MTRGYFYPWENWRLSNKHMKLSQEALGLLHWFEDLELQADVISDSTGWD